MPLQAAARLLQVTAIAKSAAHPGLQLLADFREELRHKLRICRQLRSIEPRGVRQQSAGCLLYTSPSPRDKMQYSKPSSA